ncbi:MAG: 2-hydroxyacid dehydrogenase [Alphaproteobacteria bacterium]
MNAAATKPKVLVTRLVPPAIAARLARDFEATLNQDDRLYATDELIAKANGYDALLLTPSEKMSAEIIARLPGTIKVIATVSVGFEHIDVAAAKARGIVATNTPDVLTDATADIALLLMLGAARRAHEGEALIRAGQWKSWNMMFLLGTHVSGKRLGIVGMGRIGRAVARRARGFGMEIHYYNRTRLAAELEAGAAFHADVDALMPHCDFLSMHCPSTPETRNLLDARRIALLPKGAIVVNTARGDVVDDEALIAALKSGHVAAAGLDVYRGEPRMHPEYPKLPNTFLLPHLGSATVETRDAMGNLALDNIAAVMTGRKPLTPL